MILDGKVVIVTGGARGLGQAIAVAVAEAGARVAVLDVIDTAETLALLKDLGPGQHLGVHGDVTDFEGLRAAVQQVADACGAVHGLINNAGLYKGVHDMPFEEITEEQWDRMMAINVKGVWNVTRAVTPLMREQGYGKIVNVSSTTVLVGAAGMSHYVASKGAVFALTRSLSRELGPAGVRVNTVMPGLTMSQASMDNLGPALGAVEQMVNATTALGRPQQPADLPGTMIYLLSELSDAVTGQAIVVDGGQSHW
ncbi:SDR family NAD(P)-dependent oxidoreductase [Actinocorallia sp. A-T 12471]|uniref:SDR family NAD(P)-dependent oxidoreductase n=1 Tax=Actinocorallia sp. A-T 12471 TaxID=3089813 RepID=UPI0029D33610|nr:SDR family oxidoreductase [Actinocorallia sp. A-T 12471]MDX6740615.1 SDR family oxidoreductase [Actinocorallia sp. A-T 12471]